jgi:hypothetical protein
VAGCSWTRPTTAAEKQGSHQHDGINLLVRFRPFRRRFVRFHTDALSFRLCSPAPRTAPTQCSSFCRSLQLAGQSRDTCELRARMLALPRTCSLPASAPPVQKKAMGACSSGPALLVERAREPSMPGCVCRPRSVLLIRPRRIRSHPTPPNQRRFQPTPRHVPNAVGTAPETTVQKVSSWNI